MNTYEYIYILNMEIYSMLNNNLKSITFINAPLKRFDFDTK